MWRLSAASHLGRRQLVRKGGIVADLCALVDTVALHQTGPVPVGHLTVQRLRPDTPRPRLGLVVATRPAGLEPRRRRLAD